MPIIAALISRGSVVLAEYSPPGTNFPSIARRLAAQIPSTPDSKNSYNYEQHNFNYLVESGLTYICMTDQEMKLRVPYAFLYDINNRFKSTYREKVSTATSLAMNDTFSRVIRDRIEFFSNDRNADKISKVKGEIEDAKTIMVKNIDKVLERGEKIEMLVSKTEDLNQQSQTFKKKSTQLKRKMCWQNTRLCCILIIVVTAIVLALVLLFMWHFGIISKIIEEHNAHHSTSSSTTSVYSVTTSTPADTTTGLTSGLTTGGSTTGITTGLSTTGAKATTGPKSTTG